MELQFKTLDSSYNSAKEELNANKALVNFILFKIKDFESKSKILMNNEDVLISEKESLQVFFIYLE